MAIGGFDPQFRVAGDDVDICWRLQERGWTIGFSPAAVVLHRRRRSVRALPQAAVGVRQGGGAARAQVAGQVQPRRPSRLGGPRVRRLRSGAGGAGPDRLRHLGHQPLPVALRPHAEHARGAAADAGVVPAARRCSHCSSIVGIFAGQLVPWTEGAPVRVELLCSPAPLRSRAERAPRRLARSTRRLATGAVGCSRRDDRPVPAPADRAARGTAARRAHAVASPRRARVALPVPQTRTVWSEHWRSQTDRLLELERDLARAVHDRRARQRLRPLGHPGAAWPARRRRGCASRSRSTGRGVSSSATASGRGGRGRCRRRRRPAGLWARRLRNRTTLALAALVGRRLVLVVAARLPGGGAGVALVLRAIGDEVGSIHRSHPS